MEGVVVRRKITENTKGKFFKHQTFFIHVTVTYLKKLLLLSAYGRPIPFFYHAFLTHASKHKWDFNGNNVYLFVFFI